MLSRRLFFLILLLSACAGNGPNKASDIDSSLDSTKWLHRGDRCKPSGPNLCIESHCVQASPDVSDFKCSILADSFGCRNKPYCAYPSNCDGDQCSLSPSIDYKCSDNSECGAGRYCYSGKCQFAWGTAGCGSNDNYCQAPSICRHNECLLPAGYGCAADNQCLTGNCGLESIWHLDTATCVLNDGDSCQTKQQCKAGSGCCSISGEYLCVFPKPDGSPCK